MREFFSCPWLFLVNHCHTNLADDDSDDSCSAEEIGKVEDCVSEFERALLGLYKHTHCRLALGEEVCEEADNSCSNQNDTYLNKALRVVLGAYEEIGSEALPLGVLPMTGDSSDAAGDMSRAALLALAGVAMTAAGMRRKEEECQ